jgi:hypothetical protein
MHPCNLLFMVSLISAIEYQCTVQRFEVRSFSIISLREIAYETIFRFFLLIFHILHHYGIHILSLNRELTEEHGVFYISKTQRKQWATASADYSRARWSPRLNF